MTHENIDKISDIERLRVYRAVKRKMPRAYGKKVNMFGACTVEMMKINMPDGYSLPAYHYTDNSTYDHNFSPCTTDSCSDITNYILRKTL
ncbi:MAG: hypothetical protein JSW17_01680 [Candidatus Omnitrophota bacterium]|jgi:hypothetical protein|nr:MAG: hypothetical protein JSW17_01680 [Candidatus Omnitrophota bacterium]